MNEPNWFYVFNATRSLWLQEDEREWGPYHGAAEFSTVECAREIAEREMKTARDCDDVVTVLGDFGHVKLT